MNYQAWYALGELVDNAIDSFLLRKEELRAGSEGDPHLRIVIEIEASDGGYIRVWDNAGGISAGDYQRAFVTAEPPKDSAGLSQFGVGMKSASCWFAREWRVRSTALGESQQVNRLPAAQLGESPRTPRVARSRTLPPASYCIQHLRSTLPRVLVLPEPQDEPASCL